MKIQDEITVHNIGLLNEAQMLIYIGLSWVGVFSLRKNVLKQRLRFFPDPLVGWYLLFPAVFYNYSLYSNYLFVWAEVVEVIFYSGLFLLVLDKSKQSYKTRRRVGF